MTKRSIGFLGFVALMITSAGAFAQNVPAGFTVDTLVTGLTAPHDLAELPDGRYLLAERNGPIKVWVPATGQVATIGTVGSPTVETGSERGLLSVCIDPDFANNGYIYTWSSRNTSNFMWLTRHTVTGDLTTATSTNLTLGAQYIIINDAADNAFNHNGGTVRFGADGFLYLSIGDDASSCTAQSRTSLQGVLLRLDVSNLPAGSGGPANKALLVAAGNPFAGAANLNERLVIGWGLRNPYSFNIDPVTGDLFIADVGQNAREEYDQFVFANDLANGVNFGWPWMEGIAGFTSCGGAAPAGLRGPIDDYAQSVGGVSIMSAGVMRNAGRPNDFGMAYEGNVFHVDFYNGTMERLVQTSPGSGVWQNAPAVPGQPSASYWGTGFASCPHFEQSQLNGAIYYVNRPGTGSNGSLRRIRPLGPVDQITVVSGQDQVGAMGRQFKQPLVVQVTTAGGAPIVGTTVTFSPSSTLSVGTPSATTNANGFASTTVTSAGLGGAGTVTISTPGGLPGGTTASLFGRAMRVIFNQTAATDLLIVLLSNTSNTTPGTQIPFLFGFSLPPINPITTPYGELQIDPVGFQNTIIVEDAFGVFGGSMIQGAFGNPNKTLIYSSPAGAANGLGSVAFQAIWFDASVLTSILGTTDSNIGIVPAVPFTF